MKKKKIGFRPLALCYACLFYLFLYLPIAVVVAFSFNTSQLNVTFQGFTFEWYGRMFENVQLMQSFFNTLIVAAVSTLLSVILGHCVPWACTGLNSEDGKLSAICCIFLL